MTRRRRLAIILCVSALAPAPGCRSQTNPPAPAAAAVPARNLVLVTIDTLRADRVGAYGYAGARTPAMDAIARAGVQFTHAYATAPITLPSHASMLSGLYPPGHGSRHNGIAMTATVPTLATVLDAAGFATAAFVSAFPLDRRFGLERGFDEYDDALPRAPDGTPLNERAGADTVRRARTWLDAHRTERFFLWMHLFEPHAPYGGGAAAGARPLAVRYDEEIATSDAAAGSLISALGEAAASTIVIVTADHGEAFGEHGEIGHSIFIYDTTLRVPLLLAGPGVPAGRQIAEPVSLVDVAPTVMALLDVRGLDPDGVPLVPLWSGGAIGDRSLYAESFAPLFDFGWSALRSVRDRRWKYSAAPQPELYDVERDPAETTNLAHDDPQRAAQMLARVERYSVPADASASASSDAVRRLRALGYFAGAPGAARAVSRPDPKDRIAVASRIASVTSGEVAGAELIATLDAILRDDPGNPQAHLRLGYAELQRGRCDRAEPHLRTALAAQVPSADAGLGLADCRLRARDLAGARQALEAARAAEPGNPVVDANLGLVLFEAGETDSAIGLLRSALGRDPTRLEARFTLARALGRAGKRQEALAEAQTLMSQLARDAPQRQEVQRLIDALR